MGQYVRRGKVKNCFWGLENISRVSLLKLQLIYCIYISQNRGFTPLRPLGVWQNTSSLGFKYFEIYKNHILLAQC